MRRSVSFVIAYFLLLIAVFLADALLVAVFVGIVEGEVSGLPVLVERFGGGVVRGAYSIAPYYAELPSDHGTAIVKVTGLHVVIVNPNPAPVDVVLLAHYPQAILTFKILDVIYSFGIEWDGGSSPEGVSVVDAAWFKAFNVRKAIRMMPHTVASFTIPSYYGVPEKLLACTKMGCVRLETVGEQIGGQETGQPWIIFPETEPPKPQVKVSQTWMFFADLIGGYVDYCVAKLKVGGKIISQSCGSKIACCSECPGGACQPANINTGKRGSCKRTSGPMLSYSLVKGFPPNVIAGYLVTDPVFTFKTPDTIRIGGFTYRLHGLDSSEVGIDEGLIPQALVEYDRQSCFDMNITIIIHVKPYLENRVVTFEHLWRQSAAIYFYVAVKGNTIYPPNTQIDRIRISLFYIDPSGKRKPIGTIESENGFEDNAVELARNQRSWLIEPSEAKEIVVVVNYYMVGPQDSASHNCFKKVFGYLLHCGNTYERKVRLPFYIEIIPSEYLTAG